MMSQKVARIVWNTNGWKKPSGAQGKASGDTYESDTGFGHDEWLLDDSRIIDGCHYAFIEPLRKGQHQGNDYQIHFFTINASSKKKLYLGYIDSVHCLTTKEATQAIEEYKKRGWIKAMQEEITAVGGDASSFGIIEGGSAISILNIRFRMEDVHFLSEPKIIAADDDNTRATYYRLYDYRGDFKLQNNTNTIYLRRGDKSEDGKLEVIDEDRLCFIIRNVSGRSIGDRTISKALLQEFIEFEQKNPGKSPSDARAALSGKSTIDKYEYGDDATLLKLAKLNREYAHRNSSIIIQDTALNQFARKVFRELQKEDRCAALEPFLMQQPNSDWTYFKDETCRFGIGGPTYNKNMMFDTLDEIGQRQLYFGSLWRFENAEDGTPYYDLLPYVINKCYSQKFEIVREPAGEGDGRAKYVFKMIRKAVVADSYTKYLRALRTKPFLLLAGISGTGKSRIVREMAFHSCPKELRDADGTTPSNYCMIEVKPNWHDSSELLGYYSNITHTFHSTKFIDFLRKAKNYPQVPFFVCLDEMNLAPVEQYFAEFLSVLETRALPKDNQDHFVSGELVSYENMKMLGDTEALTLPDNVFVVGTVNMDDTTHQFSRKVIDRAMTIEMNGGKLSDMFGRAHELEYPADDGDVWTMNDKLFGRFLQADYVLETYAEYADQIRKVLPDKLNKVNEVLRGTPFEVSYRVLNELTLYLATLLDEGMNFDAAVDAAFDQIVLMKILPRIEGDEDMFAIQGDTKNRLEKLMEVMPQASDSWAKLDEMNKRLKSGFTRFWP